MWSTHVLKWILGVNECENGFLHINTFYCIRHIFIFLRNSLSLFINFNLLCLIFLIQFKPRGVIMLCKWLCSFFIPKWCLFIFILDTACPWAFIESLYISSWSSASPSFCCVRTKRLNFYFLNIKLCVWVFEGKRIHFVMTERIGRTHSMFVWLVITVFSWEYSWVSSVFIFKGAKIVRVLERNFILLLIFIIFIIFLKIVVSSFENLWIVLIKSLIRESSFEFLWRFNLFEHIWGYIIS
jgi:hypothetical protein